MMGGGGGTEAARLFVRVTGDVSDATRKMDEVSSKATHTGGLLKNALGTAVGFAGATVAMAGIGSAFGSISSGVIGMNSQLETSTLQFTTLMKDSDKAQKHVAGLFDFAAKTPFETGPIIEASRIMQTFGGDALNTKKNLTLFGDAAAAVSAPINEVAFWSSRAYAAIQGGQPFGEARMRLMELGIITPQVAQKMEDLQASGASATEVWGAMQGELGKFSGAMEKQATTWEGLTSTMSDSIKMTLATAGKPLFDMLKKMLKGFNDLVASPAFQGALAVAARGIAAAFDFVARAIGAAVDTVATVINVIQDVLSGDIGVAMDDFANGFGVASEVFEGSAKSIPGLLEGIGVAIGSVLGEWVGTITARFGAIAQEFVGWIGPVIPQVAQGLAGLAQAVYGTIWSLIQQVVPKLAEFGKAFVAWVAPLVPQVLAALASFATSMFTWVIAQVPLIAQQLMTWASAFIDWIAPMIPPFLAQLGEWALQMAGWILSTGIPMAMDALANLANKFLEWVGPMVAKLPGVLLQFATTIVTWLATKAVPTLVPKMMDLAGKLLGGLLDGLGKVPGALWSWLTNSLLPALMNWGPQLLKAGADLAGQLGRAFANGIAGLIEGAVNALISGINSFKIDFKGIDLGPLGKVGRIYWGGLNLKYVKLPRFEQGTLDTGVRSGIAILDPHEAVIPAELASRLRQGNVGASPSGIVINIGTFYGTEQNVRDLSRSLGREVRYQQVRRAS